MDHILSKVLQQIGYDAEENEEDLVMCLREEAAKWACLIDNSECRTAATVRLIDDIRIPVQDKWVVLQLRHLYKKKTSFFILYFS